MTATGRWSYRWLKTTNLAEGGHRLRVPAAQFH